MTIMKGLKICILIAMLSILTGCNKEEELYELLINIKEISVPVKGGNICVDVASSHPWSAVTEQNWIEITLSDENFSLKIDKNNSGRSRVGKININNGSLSHTITITQSSESILKISESQHEIDASGGDISVDVEVEGDIVYGIKISHEWIVKDSTNVSDKDSYKFYVLPNETYESRTGYIIFETDLISDTVTVSQSGASAFFLDYNELRVDEKGGEYSIKLNHTSVNYVYEFETSSDWVTIAETKSMKSDSLILNIQKNQSKKQRDAVLIFRSQETDDQEYLTIIQSGAPDEYRIVHSNNEYDIPELNGEDISGTVDWGDGSDGEEYSPYMTHHYSMEGEYTVSILSRNATGFKMPDIINITRIEL